MKYGKLKHDLYIICQDDVPEGLCTKEELDNCVALYAKKNSLCVWSDEENSWLLVELCDSTVDDEHVEELKPNSPLIPLDPAVVRNTFEILEAFTKRAKALGGTYFHRYPHVKCTKFWYIKNEGAFIQAARELNLEYEVRSNPDYMGGKSFYVLGHTLRGVKSRKYQVNTSA
jgi:hypothetical protein